MISTQNRQMAQFCASITKRMSRPDLDLATTSFRQLETKGSNLSARSFRGPGGKRQNQMLVRLLRRSSLPARGAGVIFHRVGRILTLKRMLYEK